MMKYSICKQEVLVKMLSRCHVLLLAVFWTDVRLRSARRRVE